MLRRDLTGSRGLTARDVREAYNTTHGAAILRDGDRFYRVMARRVLARVAASRKASPRAGRSLVLDAGCGGGYLLREIRRAAGEAAPHLHGVEISDVALREARRQAPEAHLVLGQGERLPYPSRTFDAVACLGNLEHFIDPEGGARELQRVCRAGGDVWVLLPNAFYSGVIWRVIRTGYGPNHHQVIDRFATLNEWRDLLEAAGLRVEEVAPYNRFKWWKRLLPMSLAYHFLYRTTPAWA